MRSVPKKEVYSPYDISLICKSDLSVVSEWVATGRLESFKTPGGHSRIKFSALEEFLKKNHYALPENWGGAMEKFRVLVVEDDLDLLELMGELLKEEPKLEIALESNGFDAALKIGSWRPDLILLDFVLPGMDGFEVCKKLKRNPETCDIPIIATTSLSNLDNRRAVMEAGISSFIGKPFQSENLLKAVRELLGILLVN